MPANRVKLSQIPTLTFYADKQTASRRTSPIPQLKCKGPACKHFQPDVVQCYNMGGSGGDIQWKCEADLPEGMRLGGVEVSCEGWSKPGDEWVLKGSCGLEYRLIDLPHSSTSYHHPHSPLGTSSNLEKYIFWLFFYAVALWLAYKFFTTVLRPYLPSGWRNFLGGGPRGPGGGGGGGGGGGWGSWFPSFGDGGGGPRGPAPQDPPPPYPGYRPKPEPSPPRSSPFTSPGYGSSSATGGRVHPGEGWQPGFWTGLGLGAGAAALAGGLRGRREREREREREYDWERERLARAGLGGGWWGNGLGGGGLGGLRGLGAPQPRVVERVVVREDRGPASAGPSRPRSSPSGEGVQMRRSTGYGGTNVR